MSDPSLPIESVEWFVVKVPRPYRYSELEDEAEFVPGTDYFFDYAWDQVYSLNIESTFVKVTAESGEYGWGEIHEPVLPEVGATIVEELLGPMLLGRDATKVDVLRERMYKANNVRGHYQGHMIDAISGLDIALWDLVGTHRNAPVSELLGGRERDHLPAYVSIPGATPEEQAPQAREFIEEGFSGVKTFGGHGVATDAGIADDIRSAIGPDPHLLTDVFWSYTVPEAADLSRRLADHDVDFLEAPLQPEDVSGHARLVERSDIPIAVGEPIRTLREFADWIERDALDVAQPDIVLTGLTQGRRIAELASVHGKPVAPHHGAGFGIGMAATWHLASTLHDLLIQEHQPVCFEATNEFLDPELVVDGGELVVPDGPGLGVDIALAELEEYVTAQGRVSTATE